VDEAAPQATATATAVGTPSTERPTAWPIALAVNADTKRVYVANQYLSTISVIDEETNAIVATVAVGERPASVAVNPNTNRIYVAMAATSDVSVIDGATDTVVATISMAVTP